MKALFSEAGRAALYAFFAAIGPLAVGIYTAPNLNEALLLATVAMIAGLNAITKAITVFVPRLEIGGKYGPILTAGIRAGLSTFLVTVSGVYTATNLDAAQAAGTALIVAVAGSAFSAIVAAFTPGQFPFPDKGVVPPGVDPQPAPQA